MPQQNLLNKSGQQGCLFEANKALSLLPAAENHFFCKPGKTGFQ
jgi:hypothetical protein